MLNETITVFSELGQKGNAENNDAKDPLPGLKQGHKTSRIMFTAHLPAGLSAWCLEALQTIFGHHVEENLSEVVLLPWRDEVNGRKTIKEVGTVTASEENVSQLNVGRTAKTKRPGAAERLQ